MPWIDEEDEALVDLACRLVRQPSVLGGEDGVASIVAVEMELLGFDEVFRDPVGNVLGVVEGSSPGPVLLFDAHLDTVGIGRPESWTVGPFEGLVKGGRIWGRGSTDMKGALAAMIRAGGNLNRETLAGRLVVCGSIGEEQTEGTALKGVLESFCPDFVVIGEPSDLKLARGGRGRAEFILDVAGRPAHASSPELGKNAVLEAIRVIREVERLEMPRHDLVGAGVQCLTALVSDPFPAQSMVPGRCLMTYERRLVPGDTLEGVNADFEDCCRQAEVETTVELAEARVTTPTGQVLVSRKWYPPWETLMESPIVRGSVSALESVGLMRGISAYRFCTNAALTAGELGLPTVGYGPSREALAHVVDEYIEIDQLTASRVGYEAIARTLLSQGGPA